MIETTASLIHAYDSPSKYVRYLIFQTQHLLEFSEGQFVMLEADCGGTIMKNPYSIATTNRRMKEEKHLGIVVKKTSDHGMSHHLTHIVQPGDELRIKGPVGHYTDAHQHDNYLFVSVGSGLSPNVGLFQHLVYETHAYNKIVNIFGERYHTHIVPEIHDIFTKHSQSNITNFFHLSQEKDIPQGYTNGHVQDSIEASIELLGTQTSCFLCGKPEMVDDVSKKLEKLGVAKQDITFEKY